MGSWHPLDESRAHCAMPPLKASPDLAQFQAKSFDNSFAGEVIDVHQFLGFPPGAVHIDRAPIRIDQPPERRTVMNHWPYPAGQTENRQRISGKLR